MKLSDDLRRGLRTAVDVVLSAATSGLLLLLINVVKEPDLTAAQFATLTAALTPVLSTIKNNLEDRAGKSLLISKNRPEPDQVDQTVPPLVTRTEEETPSEQTSSGPHFVEPDGPFPDFSEQVALSPLPAGMVLLAVDPDEVDEHDLVIGYTR